MKSVNNYMYGSAAPQLPERPNKEEHRIHKTPSLRKVAVAEPEPVRYPMAKMVICILVGFVILFTLISRFAVITEMNGQLAALNEELEQLKDGNKKLQAEISASINQENIRRIAEEKLNMKMPDSYQKIPVKVPKINYSTVAQQVPDEKETTLISMFAALFH